MNGHNSAVGAALPPQIESYLRGELRPLSDVECDLFVAVGTSMYQEERYADAADMFRALVLGRPESCRAWACLAMCHDAVEDFDRAAALYDLAVRAPLDEGYRGRAHIYNARTLFWLERFDEAATHLESAEVHELADDLHPIVEELREELARTRGGRRW